jgi:hypothetical protein
MKNIPKILGLAMICSGLMTAIAVQADAQTTKKTVTTTTFTTNDRMLLGDWVIFNNQGCPAGSMMVKTTHLFGKSSHRCTVPKGSTISYYEPGAVLPSTTTYTELPGYVVEQLPPPPSGEVYVSADNNVYLINPQTRTVVQSVRIIGPQD